MARTSPHRRFSRSDHMMKPYRFVLFAVLVLVGCGSVSSDDLSNDEEAALACTIPALGKSPPERLAKLAAAVDAKLRKLEENIDLGKIPRPAGRTRIRDLADGALSALLLH